VAFITTENNMLNNYKGNSAYIKLQAKDKRRDLFAAIIGSACLIVSALIGAAVVYAFAFTVLALGA
jgi:hypothetical protein